MNANNASCTRMSGPSGMMRLKEDGASPSLTNWKALALSSPTQCMRCMAPISPSTICRSMGSLLRCCLKRNLDWDSGMWLFLMLFLICWFIVSTRFKIKPIGRATYLLKLHRVCLFTWGKNLLNLNKNINSDLAGFNPISSPLMWSFVQFCHGLSWSRVRNFWALSLT